MARILLAEDDVDIRDLVALRLASMGHDVVAVGDGLAATRECRESDFHLVITDITMPGMDGIELVRWIRARTEHVSLPVLVMSALVGPELRAVVRDAGATAYLAKPFPLARMVAEVDRLLGDT